MSKMPESKLPVPKLPVLLALLALLVATVPAGAATLLTLQSHQDAFEVQGQTNPAQDRTVEVWIGDGAIVRNDGASSVLMTKDKLYLINHQEKSYNALDLPLDLEALLPPEMAERMRQVREQAAISAELVVGDETRTVGEWTAKRYDLTLTNPLGLTVEQVIWASPEADVDASLYHGLAGALAALQPGGGDWVDQLDAVEGFPVLRETTMRIGPGTEVTTTEELVSVATREAPEGTFAPPADYQEKPFSPGGGAPAP